LIRRSTGDRKQEQALTGDPYSVLGVEKTATPEEVQKAYRQLAKKLHPDLNPGDKKAEERFKEISAAYDIIGDVDKRARFDRGEIDASGTERPPREFYREHAGRSDNPYARDGRFADFADGDDVFSELFRRRSTVRLRGQDVHYAMQVDFLDALNGARREVTLPDGSMLEVSIPRGTRDGQTLRLRGKGMPGLNGGPPGDALVEVSVRPHELFVRKDDDIHIDVPVPLEDAVLGGKINVPTAGGPVTMTIPKWSNTGRVMRLKGKGAPRADGGSGDQYVTLKVMLPDQPDARLEQLVADWSRPGPSTETNNG
jgi:DnaJ-class molecular chaperone